MQGTLPVLRWFQENSPLLLTWLCGVISATVLIFVVPGWHPGLGQNSVIRSHRMGAWDSDIIWHLYITLSFIKYNWSALQTGLSRCHEVFQLISDTYICKLSRHRTPQTVLKDLQHLKEIVKIFSVGFYRFLFYILTLKCISRLEKAKLMYSRF